MTKFKRTWLNWRRLIIDDRELSTMGKAVGLYLNTYMNDSHDMAFPSIARIRGELNIKSNTTVIKYLDELEAKGFIKRQKRFGNSTVYHATIPEKIASITDSVVLQDMDSSITEYGPPVLQNMEPNKQENKQYNKQVPQTPIIPPEINPRSWAEFEQHRKEIKKPLSDLARVKAMNVIKHLSHEQQAKVIDKSIQSRWAGLFPEKANEKNSGISKHSAVIERLAERERFG